MKKNHKANAPSPNSGLTHFDQSGNAVMVDVSGKQPSVRVAVAEGEIHVGKKVLAAITAGTVAKGDVLGAARLAGIMGAKRTPDLIPLCHSLSMDSCAIDFDIDKRAATVRARCTVTMTGRTGAEMEALTGAGTALLTIYDMTKALNKRMVIGNLRLLEKSGGKSGHFINED